MAQLQLSPCEAVEITFAETDGKITVAFAAHEIRSLIGCDHERAMQTPPGISVHVDLPDDLGRVGIVYHESGVSDEPELEEGPNGLPQPVKPPKEPKQLDGFSPVKARQLVQRLDDWSKGKGSAALNFGEIRDQLLAAASLVDGLVDGIDDSGVAPTSRLRDVKNALTAGKV